jgi:hypothetical protein
MMRFLLHPVMTLPDELSEITETLVATLTTVGPT